MFGPNRIPRHLNDDLEALHHGHDFLIISTITTLVPDEPVNRLIIQIPRNLQLARSPGEAQSLNQHYAHLAPPQRIYKRISPVFGKSTRDRSSRTFRKRNNNVRSTSEITSDAPEKGDTSSLCHSARSFLQLDRRNPLR